MAWIALQELKIRQAFSSPQAAHRTPPKTWVMQNASQLARAAGTVRGDGLIGDCIQPAGLRVTLDRGIECGSVKSLEPRAETRQFVRAQLLNSLLDLFCVHIS
jgi:hypothetical protein